MEQYSRTEFPRFEPDGGGGSVSTFFNKLLNLPAVFSAGEASASPPPASSGPGDAPRETVAAGAQRLGDAEDGGTVGGAGGAEGAVEGRSLHNVLRRISSLVALGSAGGGTRYADTELARYWMPDDISRECLECEAKFSALRRRHHCRVCGQIFCSRCCSQRVPGQICGCAGGLRVCTYCCKVVLGYLQERDISGEISSDLRTLQENLQVKFPEKASASRPRDSFMLAREPEERTPARASHKEALQDVFRHVAYALPTQQHRYRLVRYSGVWRGCDVMQWIMDNTSHTTRSQASAVCQGLVSEGYMECATEQLKFADYALYRPAQLPDSDGATSRDDGVGGEGEGEGGAGGGGARLAASVSSYCLDLNLGDSSARCIKAPKSEERSPASGEGEEAQEDVGVEPPPPGCRTERSGEGAACGRLAEAGREHLVLLLRQCLAREALPPAWLHVLFPLCQQAADAVTPDLYSSELDVRTYVQVKKVAGGAPSDSRLVSGVVLSKNVAHRGMPHHLASPSLLLLDCSIAYQRVENKLTSLEPVLLQEHEYLLRMAARVLALRPSVVLVRGTVARTVQDELRAAGVALATVVREKALKRAARCLKADIVTSIDSRIGTPRLGTCNSFYVKNFDGKTLMVLEGCTESALGCCMLLRGAGEAELARVKRVVRFMLLACYNWKLERAFLADVGAALPEGLPFADADRDHSPDLLPPDNINTDASTGDAEAPQFEEVSANAVTVPTWSERAEDPLQEARSGARSRKTESDKTLSCGVPIRDFSDPLRARRSFADDEVFHPRDHAALTADADANRWWLEDVVLSMSPHVRISAPYLETEAGRRCELRRYFCSPLFRAAPPPVQRHDSQASTPRRRHTHHKPPHLLFTEVHEFARAALTASAEEPRVRAALAHYRATGGRLHNTHNPECPVSRPSVVRKSGCGSPAGGGGGGGGGGEAEGPEEADPLAPENHQRLNLLIYSFSSKSANVPDFCVNPWIVRMEMYGRHDISLGAFLDKYCFNTEYRCPSRTCHAPMLHHVRRFVHGDGCITITCNTIGNSTNLQKVPDEQSKQVTWWSRCGWCAGAATPTERVSRAALALSLAKYLELRLLAPRYTRAAAGAACVHSLNHAHAHYFAKGLTTACFRYSKIKWWDVVLPPSEIRTRYDTRAMRDALLHQANDLVLKGHEVFSAAGGGAAGGTETAGEAEREYGAFKQHLEQVHLALTSASLQQQRTRADVVRWLWGAADRLVAGERLVRDAHERYSAPAPPAPPPPPPPTNNKLLRALHDAAAEEKSDVEDSVNESGNTESSETASRSDVEHTGGEEEEERGDRKTVRAILSQLLSTSQPAYQGGVIISGGVLPVVVFAGEIGSVIAAGLASVQYQQQLQLLMHQQHQQQQPSAAFAAAATGGAAEQEESGGAAAGAGAGEARDKSDADSRSKSARSNEHIEVLLKDGLLCRVYYAAQFQKLRAQLLAPLTADTVADSFSQAAAAPADTDGGGGGGGHKRTSSGCGKRTSAAGAGAGGGGGGTGLCEVEEGFIRSLARCVAWTARGGKSGSTFCKTRDDRYVLKEMSKQEWQQFLEFAPHYFQYVVRCYQSNHPTLLARIVGVYSVGGAGNGVLVMENLFYEHGAALTHRFDLKGACRNRLTADTAQPDAVLMDENLLNMRWEVPLYVQAHTAEVLWAAVERDTEFLAAHSVMDYSLLLGVHSQQNKLVLGIIDYIRTFTWDKKLEHLVKKNLGSGQPTIVSPAQYRERFCAAARKYFLHAPSRWDGLHRGLAL